ncbi:hypothetical protein BU26DRAFT_518786 [Trematosphaeria pertusa]|uniref:C2H2-type domain-containing protein n=1 Tax=Trematosphaeria pertusa TaxID=390896 RepID=A0A6A6ILP7_9PLEO|nr:uncharacterized protein BU26DRAFT_518786 [Trematosphaeria pertusa]KAF2250403.1 hypothetical protein BU26DRAFT_518786 [Trematosphaeria pertusa]
MTLHRQHTNQEAPAARHLQKVGISGSRTSYPPPTPPPLLPPSSSLPVDQRSPERSPLKPLPRSGTNSSRRSADSGYASDCYSDPGHRPRSWASPTRKLNADEENAACAFIEHADECWDCNCLGSDRRLREQLCGIGASLAGELGRLIYISQDGGIWSRTDNRQVRLGYKLGLRFESVCGWAEALERSLCRGDTSLLPRDNDPWNHSRGHDPRRANSIQKTPPPLERARLGKGGTESARTLTKALETIASYQKAPDLRRRTIFEDIRKQFTDSATKRALPHQLPAAPDKTVNLGSLLVKDQSSVADSPHEPCAFFVPRWTPGESTQSRETGEATVHFDSAGRAVENALTQFEKLTFQEGGNHAASEPTDGIEGSSPSQKRHQQSSSPPSSRAYLQRLQRKRVRGDRDPGDDSGDDDGNNDRPPKRDGKRPDSAPNRRLKCPFYQRAPEKCPNKACRGEGFTDIAKLKDHIKRVHTQPLRCVRCWQQVRKW